MFLRFVKMRVHSLVEYSIQREDKMKPLKRTNPDYNKYIKSKDWYSKHPGWLKDVGYRCGLFPGYGSAMKSVMLVTTRITGIWEMSA
jgi:hypothetical protein